ncbi:MAG: DUF1127 domain-containing protein [Roseovarius sp.]|uniref:DUF1127 domain-containing protein n=1 Tax=Roseovarius sp. TaxID=1486281 RepID=UPI0032EE5C9C
MITLLARRRPHPPTRRLSLRAYVSLYRLRRALDRLDPHILRDVGLTEDAARAEAARRFWDAPHHWFR